MEIGNPTVGEAEEENLAPPLQNRHDSLEKDPPPVTKPPTRNKHPQGEHRSNPLRKEIDHIPRNLAAEEDADAKNGSAIVINDELEEDYLAAQEHRQHHNPADSSTRVDSSASSEEGPPHR